MIKLKVDFECSVMSSSPKKVKVMLPQTMRLFPSFENVRIMEDEINLNLRRTEFDDLLHRGVGTGPKT